ncbi:MAG: hypothetical protein JOZ15_13495, partial [Acidobacteria bacterium]|nr:hypothetical protein [Acidobacteriota bacterium]
MLALAVAAAAAAGHPDPAAAQTCDRTGCGWISCGTPATPVPSTNWSSSLQPAETSIPPGRDVTAFSEYTGQYSQNPYFFSIDIQNGWAFTAMDWGIKVWDIHSTPTPTAPVSYVSVCAGGSCIDQFLNGGDPNENKTPIQDVSLPAGNDTLGAVVGLGKIGTTIFDFTNKSQPVPVYQNYNVEAMAVYAANVSGTNYAFVASGQQPGALLVYNMDAARRSPACSEATPGGSCPGVYVGTIGTRAPNYVAGIDNYLVASTGASVGLDLWDVTNPASATLKTTALTDRAVYGLAMWKNGDTDYLAAFTGPSYVNASLPFQLQVFSVTGGNLSPVSSTIVDVTVA